VTDVFSLLQGGPGCDVDTDRPASVKNAEVRRKRSADRRLYDILLQRLQQQDTPALMLQSPGDYDYIGQQQALIPYQRKRNTGRCYFHAINCW